MKKYLAVAGMVLTAASSSLFGAIVVDGRSDIFEAGLGTPGSQVTGVNLGLYPVLAASFSAGSGQSIWFNSITGSTNCGAGAPCNQAIPPDGVNVGIGGTDVSSDTGISGIKFTGRNMFLVGVFLTDAAPDSGSQPFSVEFFTSGGGYDADNRVNWFTNGVTYGIGQTFYIGDGKTGVNNAAGTTQIFSVPDSATRLFLGFVDGGSIGAFTGHFGAYDDNGEQAITADINLGGLTPAPEPGTVLLMGLGLAGLGLLRKKLA